MTSSGEGNSFINIRGQVARVLLEHAADGPGAQNRLAKRDIASTLGVGWDKVHLSLKSLCDDGSIRIERNRMIINRGLLQKVAGDTEKIKSTGG